MAQLPTFNPIGYLVERRFPGYRASWGLLPNTKGFDPVSRERIVVAAGAYAKELGKKSPTEINSLVVAEKAKALAESAVKMEVEEQNRFFNRPGVVADYEHWSKASYWTLDEAVALSFGKPPETVNWKSVESFTKISRFALQYNRRRDLARHAKDFGQLYDPVLPGIFLAWAKRTDVSVPAELVNAVEVRGIQIADWKTMYDDQAATHAKTREEDKAIWTKALKDAKVQFDLVIDSWKGAVAERDSLIQRLQTELAAIRSKEEADQNAKLNEPAKPLGQRERESMLRLIIGMAIEGYAYELSASRTTTAKEISDDLQKLGIGLDEDTVRKYLQEGRNLVPRDQPE